jgi:hypothetical protein
LETLLSGARFNDGWLRGTFAGNLHTDDNRGRPYHLQLDARLRDNTLSGPITATTLPDNYGANAVTHWLELEREKPPAENATKTPDTAGQEAAK